MQITVIIFNVTLACCCLVVARWIWLFRLSLRRSTQALVLAEMVAHDLLQDAPAQILQGKLTVRQWHQFWLQLGPAIQQGQAVLTWANRGRTLGMFMLGETFKVRSSRSKRR